MTTAARNNEGKPTLGQLLHFYPALVQLAAHCDAGRVKYPDLDDGRPNWTLGGKPDSEYIDAALRHLAAHVRGEELDHETGTRHLVAALWNLAAIVTLNHPDPPSGVRVSPEKGEEGRPGPSRRIRFEGEEGELRFVIGQDVATFYADTGRKVTLTGEQWSDALRQGIAVRVDD